MGKVFKFHNDLDTDQIIASQYLLLPTIDDMKSHAMESQDPTFAERVQPGDFVVGGSNFGCRLFPRAGSQRPEGSGRQGSYR